MTFDVHQLDAFLLVGSAVTFLAILAVRVSSRVGPAQPADLPADGRAAGRGGARHPLRRRRAGPRARLRGAGADPGRGWSHHRLARGAALDAARAVAGHASAWPSRWRSWRSARTTCSACRGSWRVLLGAVTSPTDAAAVFSVLRGRPAAAAAGRRPRGRVRAQRRPHRRARHADLDRSRRGARACPCVAGIVVFELVAGVADRAGGRLRRRLGDAARGAAVLRPLPARGAVPGAAGVRRRGGAARLRASPRCTSPRWCSATATCRTGPRPGRSRRAWRGWPRSGCS